MNGGDCKGFKRQSTLIFIQPPPPYLLTFLGKVFMQALFLISLSVKLTTGKVINHLISVRGKREIKVQEAQKDPLEEET